MVERPHPNRDRPLSVHLHVHLDREPVTGWLRCDRGAQERFVGWLGFVEALRHMAEAQSTERS
ncbi:MAG TPA: hypothetical protein VIL49_03930 [Capillimicrobium sp.]|jgi:hypothetical protein